MESVCSKMDKQAAGGNADIVERAKSLFSDTLLQVNASAGRYFYEVSGTHNVSGSLSFLLGVTDAQLLSVYKFCGFYSTTRRCFSDDFFQSFLKAFHLPIDLLHYKNRKTGDRLLYLRIGQGTYPSKPAQQIKDKVKPPEHRLKKDGRQLVADLLSLCCRKEESPVATTDATSRSSKKANKTMTNNFSIRKLDKAALALQLVGEMKTPEKIPVMRKLLAGSSSATIHSMNNKTKRYIHVPQCANSATAAMAFRKYNVVEQIVETVGAGVRSPEGLDVGALWLGKRLFETHRAEFTSVASSIGITVAKRMSPESTAAMWHDALVTKTKQRKIAKHLFDWFGSPITAKERDVDALAGKSYVKRRYGSHSFRSRKGKKESDDDIKRRRRDITVKYWVCDPLLAAEDELLIRLQGGKQISGFQFPLLDTPAIPMCFLADHGNIAWRAGLTIVCSETDGQGEPVKLSHLLGKDSYDILESTVNPDLRKGFELLQASSLLVVGNGNEKECILVPRNAFINALAMPFQGFFMEPPVDTGNEKQKVIIDNNSWDEIPQSGSFVYDQGEQVIHGVTWQISSREDVTKEFRDKRKVEFDVNSKVELFPIILLGGGDTEWVACAIGKENMAGQHCNHCQRSQKDFIQGLGEPWTIETIKVAADYYQNILLPAAARLKTKPSGHLGVKYHPMYPIPIHLWGSPILHDELGLVKDWLTRLETFSDIRVEILSQEEVATRENLVVRTNDLEDLLFEKEELQSEKVIKELEKHLGGMRKEIEGRATVSINPRTQEPTTVPGRVTQEEQHIVDQISWEITSWHQTTNEISGEIKTAKDNIGKMKEQLKGMRETRDLTDESAEYAIDDTLCNNGVDRKVYHGQCLIGPQIMKLLANRIQIMQQLEEKLLTVRAANVARDPTTDLASVEEVKEEMAFFAKILHCYDSAFGLLRRTRTIFSEEQRTELQGAIDTLIATWPTQRTWEKKEASVTPKSHDLWFEIQQQLTYLGRFFHFMEDPIEKLHKIDRLMDAVYCHLRDYEFREESKRKQESIGKNSGVKQQMQQVTESRKRKFTAATLRKREGKVAELTTVKQERRSLP
jgi:hypothetical protein